MQTVIRLCRQLSNFTEMTCLWGGTKTGAFSSGSVCNKCTYVYWTNYWVTAKPINTTILGFSMGSARYE